ncbi:MAG: hypothetical protein O7A03_06825 [Alphaproteobacteria bacterium]|nr:hypothetical protein [Alphaproteobacteria bacterium]
MLTKFGVPAEATPIAGLDRIQNNGNWYWPDPDGQPFVILPAFDSGEVADLVAFQPHRPMNFKTRTGAVPMLGIDNTATNFGPLRIWRHPLNYLRARLEGVVILSWGGALPLLACCNEIIAEDVEHGREIRKRLSRPIALPKISVPTKAVQR